MARVVWHLVLWAWLSPGLTGCYVLSQALHQNNLINGRRRVTEVIEDDRVSSLVRDRLKRLEDVLVYAKKAGLNTEGAYRFYVDTGGRAVSYLVQAAEPDRLKFKTWWFPIVGSVPYRGYYDKSDADRMAAELEREGYDVAQGVVGAFSSLGWFEDPVYTSMLDRSDAKLAHLFFHELTHRTFWLSGSVEFNENLAEFVALYLTQQYLHSRNEPTAIEEYLAERADRRLFKAWLTDLRGELTALYRSDLREKDRPELLRRKAAIFAKFQTERLPKFATDDFQFVARRKWNNASVLGASLYSPDTERFERAHRCYADVPIGRFLEALDQAVKEYDDAFLALEKMCRGGP